MKKTHRARRPEGAQFSASVPMCTSYHRGFRVTDDPEKVTCERCRKLAREALEREAQEHRAAHVGA